MLQQSSMLFCCRRLVGFYWHWAGGLFRYHSAADLFAAMSSRTIFDFFYFLFCFFFAATEQHVPLQPLSTRPLCFTRQRAVLLPLGSGVFCLLPLSNRPFLQPLSSRFLRTREQYVVLLPLYPMLFCRHRAPILFAATAWHAVLLPLGNKLFCCN